MSIKVDDLVEAVRGELEEYADEVTGGVKQAVKEVAKATVKEVKAKSPVKTKSSVKTGNYKKSWGQIKVSETEGSIVISIRNKKFYWLTHLLENGHALKNGDRTRAFPHIKPAEDFAARELEKKVKVKVEG